MTERRRNGFLVFIALMVLVLIGLGTWQLQRLDWKKDLIRQSQAAITAKPVSMNDITAGIEHGYQVDWLRISLTGHFRHDLQRYLYKPTKQGLGYQVITPFIDTAGYVVFVERGWIPKALKASADPETIRKPQGKITITGITRLHDPGFKLFLADRDVKNNIWYWYDVKTMAASLPAGLGEKPDGSLPVISAVFVQLEPGGEPGEQKYPLIKPVRLELPNNHLQYALTWFGLALVMTVLGVYFYRTRRILR